MLSDLLSPLTRRVTLTGSDASCVADGLAAAAEPAALAASGATAVPAAPAMNLRRLKPDIVRGSVLSVMTASAA
jgi:hypothetical protein